MSITSFEHGDRTQWLTKDTGKLLLSQGFRSDFTIKCQDREWRVHQEIIGDRSDYFNVMLSRSQWKETEDACVEMTEDQPEVIQAVIEYIYTLEYTMPDLMLDEKRQFCLEATDSDLVGIAGTTSARWQNRDGTSRTVQRKATNDHLLVNTTFNLCFLILLLAAADRLGVMMDRGSGVSDLAKMAGEMAEAFYSDLHAASIVSVVDLALKFSPPVNAIRQEIVELCVLNQKLITKHNPEIEKLLQTYEGGAWMFGCRMHNRFQETIKGLKARIAMLEAQVTSQPSPIKMRKTSYSPSG